MGFFFPSSFAFAAENCVCRSTTNDCQSAFLAENPSETTCAETCKKTLGTKFATSNFAQDTAGEILVSECYQIHKAYQAALAAPEASTIIPKAPKPFIVPTLNVDIPTVSFTQPIISGDKIKSTFLADYLTGVYQFLIVTSLTIAIVMVMIGGLQYVMAASGGDVKKGKERIKNALTGLVLLLGVYLILYTVNPQLTLLKAIELQNVKEAALNDQIDAGTAQCGDLKGTITPCTATKLAYGSGLNNTLTDAVNEAAQKFGIDPFLLEAHYLMESGGNINRGDKSGPCGEVGPSQFMPTTVEGIVGIPCCSKAAIPPGKKMTNYVAACDGNRVDEWPPTNPPFRKCKTNVCGHCEEAMPACVDYFNANTGDKKQKIQNITNLTAKLISKILTRVGGDRAQELCGYNGSGTGAANYAKHASKYYTSACKKSGGSGGLNADSGEASGTKAGDE